MRRPAEASVNVLRMEVPTIPDADVIPLMWDVQPVPASLMKTSTVMRIPLISMVPTRVKVRRPAAELSSAGNDLFAEQGLMGPCFFDAEATRRRRRGNVLRNSLYI